MPIRPFLADQAFEPETIREMSLALERVCDALSLKLVDDAATRMIAGKIIELAPRRAGCLDPDIDDPERIQARRVTSGKWPDRVAVADLPAIHPNGYFCSRFRERNVGFVA